MGKFILTLGVLVTLCLGDTDAKIQELSKKIGTLDRFAELYFKRANLYCKQGAYDKAIEDFKKVRIFIDDYKDVKYQIARNYVNLGKAQLALDFSTEVLAQNPDIKQRRAYYIVQADAYILQENYEQGIKIYETQKKAKSGLNTIEVTKLAGAYYDAGKSRKSLNILKDALRNDNSNYMLAKKVVVISMEEASYSLAHAMIEKMLKNRSRHAETYYIQAQVYEAEDKVDLALKSSKLARKSLDKNSNDIKNEVLALELRLSQSDENQLALN